VGDTTGLLKILFHRQTRQWSLAECDKEAAFDGFNRLSALTENSLD
jgi:hypothetical protein